MKDRLTESHLMIHLVGFSNDVTEVTRGILLAAQQVGVLVQVSHRTHDGREDQFLSQLLDDVANKRIDLLLFRHHLGFQVRIMKDDYAAINDRVVIVWGVHGERFGSCYLDAGLSNFVDESNVPQFVVDFLKKEVTPV